MTSDFVFSIMEMVLVKLMILSKKEKKKKTTKLTTRTTKNKQVRNVVFSAEIRVLGRSLSKQISFSGRHEIRDFKLCPKEGSRED